MPPVAIDRTIENRIYDRGPLCQSKLSSSVEPCVSPNIPKFMRVCVGRDTILYTLCIDPVFVYFLPAFSFRKIAKFLFQLIRTFKSFRSL